MFVKGNLIIFHGLGLPRIPKELSNWRPFIPSHVFTREHTSWWSTKVGKDKELDINTTRDPRIRGGSWQDDKSDTRDGLWIGETLR
jgi:hypothetical protein